MLLIHGQAKDGSTTVHQIFHHPSLFCASTPHCLETLLDAGFFLHPIDLTLFGGHHADAKNWPPWLEKTPEGQFLGESLGKVLNFTEHAETDMMRCISLPDKKYL
jgi:hypothetical protein